MATQQYLVMTDGTDTVTFADGVGGPTDYKLQYPAWAPATAGLRSSELGGREIYDDVTETMQVLVSGATVPDVLANLGKLARLLDKADRWSRGEHFTPVILKYSPKGATVSSVAIPLQAVVLGRAPDDRTAGVGLPLTFADLDGTNLYVMDVTVRFRRDGVWKRITNTAAPAGFANGTIGTFAFGVLDEAGPSTISLTNFGWGKQSSSRFHDVFIVVTDKVDAIKLLAAESMALATYTSVADATAAGGFILRYTPGSTSAVQSGNIASPGLAADARLVMVLANMRNNHATNTYRVRARLDSNIQASYTPAITVPGFGSALAHPMWYNLGLAAVNGAINNVYLEVAASALGSTLDIDSIALVDVSHPYTSVQHIPRVSDSASNINGNINNTLSLDHRLLVAPEPLASITAPSVMVLPRLSDLMIYTRDQAVFAVMLATGYNNGAAGNRWRQDDSGTGLPAVNAWTITRYTTYRTPA